MGKSWEQGAGGRGQGKKNFIWFFLIFLTLFGISFADASKSRRSNAIQSMGVIQIVEKMYFNDHGEYTSNIQDFAQYTNITNIFKDFGRGTFKIELSKNKMNYTATATGIVNYCRYFLTATPKGFNYRPPTDCEQIRTKVWAIQTTFSILKLITLYLLIFFCVYRLTTFTNKRAKIIYTAIVSFYIWFLIQTVYMQFFYHTIDY